MGKYAQITGDWQEDVATPLVGAQEESARNYINHRLREWGINSKDNNVNDFIINAWNEWVAENNS